MTAALAHLSVLEVGDDSGAYAAKLFAGLGARVMRAVLPPTSSIDGLNVDPDPVVEGFLHRSKTTVILPVDPEERTKALLEMIEVADILIESGPPDVLARFGIPSSHPVLDRIDLVRTRVSPYGLDGEHALDPASDLVCSASAGFLSLGGWPDRAPTRAFGDQSWRMASLYAAVGSMVAILERDESGIGQQVDVNAQEAVSTALENSLQYYDLEHVERRRTGAGYSEAGSGVYACADGYVYVMVGRLSTAQGWVNLLNWLDEEKVEGASELRLPNWTDHTFRQSDHAQTRFREIFDAFAKDRPKAELYVEAQQRNIAICPINSPDDLLESDQLRARNFFVHSGDATFVGAPYRLSKTPWVLEPSVSEVQP
ncbi:putative subunit of succinyl-CoA:benzylsuccinate CoA-transferase [marine actinobacterium PHSC20C1]|nr:putative subunit of succinyl-CoA:benzylsuccinate CoA-transferase [marine actinobacterium PHSC20C1]